MENEIISYGSVIYASIVGLVTDVLGAVPYVFVGIIIWLIGQWLIDVAVSFIRKIDIGRTQFDNALINVLAPIVQYAGKFFLVLIIMDYFGIGETVIAALLNAFSFAIAISLGLAFGRAFESDAKKIYTGLKKQVLE